MSNTSFRIMMIAAGLALAAFLLGAPGIAIFILVVGSIVTVAVNAPRSSAKQESNPFAAPKADDGANVALGCGVLILILVSSSIAFVITCTTVFAIVADSNLDEGIGIPLILILSFGAAIGVGWMIYRLRYPR